MWYLRKRNRFLEEDEKSYQKCEKEDYIEQPLESGNGFEILIY